jgi:hypothetical protein
MDMGVDFFCTDYPIQAIEARDQYMLKKEEVIKESLFDYLDKPSVESQLIKNYINFDQKLGQLTDLNGSFNESSSTLDSQTDIYSNMGSDNFSTLASKV